MPPMYPDRMDPGGVPSGLFERRQAVSVTRAWPYPRCHLLGRRRSVAWKSIVGHLITLFLIKAPIRTSDPW